MGIIAMERIKNYIVKNTMFYGWFPFMNLNILTMPDSISALNKVVFGIFTITSILLYCIINIVGYFGCLYIIKHTELEKKYPKLSPIIKYYQNTSVIF